MIRTGGSLKGSCKASFKGSFKGSLKGFGRFLIHVAVSGTVRVQYGGLND